MDANSRKSKQLNMSHSTAQNRLRKMVMWEYVVKCGDNTCYQCGEEIEDISQLSMEHKTPWLDSGNPVELFFSMYNIAFSHLSCNIKSGRSPLGMVWVHNDELMKNSRVRKDESLPDGWCLGRVVY